MGPWPILGFWSCLFEFFSPFSKSEVLHMFSLGEVLFFFRKCELVLIFLDVMLVSSEFHGCRFKEILDSCFGNFTKY